MDSLIQSQLESAQIAREAIDGITFTVTGRAGLFAGILSALSDNEEIDDAGFRVRKARELEVRHSVLAATGGALTHGDQVTADSVVYRVEGAIEKDEISANYRLLLDT